MPSGLFVLGKEHFKLNIFYGFSEAFISEFGNVLGRGLLYSIAFVLIYSSTSQFFPEPHLDDRFWPLMSE